MAGMRRPPILLASLVLGVLWVLSAPALAGAAPRPGGLPDAPARSAAEVGAPAQQPDAPADDGTGGSADDEVDENPEPGAVDQRIVPLPNSGREPTDAGDRGGALQVLVFAAIVAGVGGIATLIVRDVRHSRARAGTAPPGAQPNGPNSSQAS
jgi:hypothetical protein